VDEPMSYTVGAVARMAGITVRTLHHYDDGYRRRVLPA